MAKYHTFSLLFSVPHFEKKKRAIEVYLSKGCKNLRYASDYLLSKRSTLSLYEAGNGMKKLVRNEVESIVFDCHPLLSILSLGDISLVRAIGSIAASANTLQELTVQGLLWFDGDVDILLSNVIKECPTVKPYRQLPVFLYVTSYFSDQEA